MSPRCAASFVIAVALSLAPSLSRAEQKPQAPTPKSPTAAAPTKPKRTAHIPKPGAPEARRPEPACSKPSVVVTTGVDSATFALTRCDGTATPSAVDELSILARPSTAAKPKAPIEVLTKKAGPDVAPGIRRVDSHLLERLEKVVEHFQKDGKAPKVLLVSGYRPKSAGSYHQVGRALDFRLDGVTNEALVAFCKTLPDTGCGYYPNSHFVHMDVRDKGAGHVTWIDISGPGEAPRYVAQWPLPETNGSALPALPPGPPSGEPDFAGHPHTRVAHPYFF
jgi:hypothetical protein